MVLKVESYTFDTHSLELSLFSHTRFRKSRYALSTVYGVFVGNSTVVDLFRAAITYIRSPVKTAAALLLKIRTGLIAGRAGSTLNAAQNDLVAGIGLPAVIAVDTEVFCVIKGTLVIPVRNPVSFDLLRDSSRVLAQIPCNILEGESFVQRILDVNTVFKSQVFLVSRNQFTHSSSSIYCCQMEKILYHESMKG